MKKFEYKTTLWLQISESELVHLNKNGSEGWRCVWRTQITNEPNRESILFYWEREIPNPPQPNF